MLLSAQLLSGLVARHEQPALARPAVRDELCDTSHRPAVLELVEDVDEVISCRDAEQATGLHERVGVGKALSGVDGAREEKVAPAQSGLADRALDFAVVDLESPVAEAASDEGAASVQASRRASHGSERAVRSASLALASSPRSLASASMRYSSRMIAMGSVARLSPSLSAS